MKTVLLIGASGGIGNKMAEVLLQQGYAVVGTYFQHPERVENLNEQQHFLSSYLDLQSLESIQKLVQESLSEHDLYAVVNCAGIVEFEGAELHEDIAIWHRTLAINLTGNFLLAKVLHQKIAENGRFIMISSTDSYYGGAITASYAASKSGINSLTKSLTLLFQDKKIRVNAVAPGWVVTPMIAGNGAEFLEKVAAINPLKRNAQPLDVAHVIKFLLSEDASYLNGQVISLDGGYTNQDPTLLLEEKI